MQLNTKDIYNQYSNEMIKEILLKGGNVFFSIFGPSMRPLFDEDAIACIKGCSDKAISVGDIVLINRNASKRKYVIHRVLKIVRLNTNIKFVTKGDSSPKDVHFSTGKECIGRLERIITCKYEYDMNHWCWYPFKTLIAALSKFSSYFVTGFLFYKKKKAGKLIFPQRMAYSIIKRIVRLGKLLSKQIRDDYSFT